jgi:hemolysin activation/secretion protein
VFKIFINYILALIILNFLLIPVATSQTIPDLAQKEAVRLQQRDAEQIKEREDTFRNAQIAPPSGEEIPIINPINLISGDCVEISSVIIIGANNYDPTKFSNLSRKLISKCTAVEKINDFIRFITNIYISDGYITSRVITNSNPVIDGILNIVVVEGKIGQIAGALDSKNPSYDSELSFAFPNMKGGLLNLRDIEQGVDQLARLGGSEPQIDIAPGDIPGSSNIIVKREKRGGWIRPSITFNNDGSSGIGRRQMTGSLDLDSIFGLADYWSLYYTRDLDRPIGAKSLRGAEGYGGFFSLPYGYTSLILSGGRNIYKSILASNGLAFQNTGDSINGSVSLDQLLFRDKRTKISLSVALSLYDTTTRIQGLRLETNSYRLISSGISLRAQRRIDDALVVAELSFSRGYDILGAKAANIGPGTDGLVFRKFEGSLAYYSTFTILGSSTDYSASLRGQVGLDPLLPAERFSVGGSSTVRGFRDDGISGASGFAFRQQFGFGLFKLFPNAAKTTATKVSAIVGYDAGAIAAKKGDPFERGFIHASVVGLRMVNRRLQTELSLAAPLSSPKTVQRQRFEFAASVRLTI